jgi:hypothetical protein
MLHGGTPQACPTVHRERGRLPAFMNARGLRQAHVARVFAHRTPARRRRAPRLVRKHKAWRLAPHTFVSFANLATNFFEPIRSK